MDQDVSLMRQLLTLNETIEEIKQKRMYGVSKDSLRASSVDLSCSSDSVSETDMFSNDEEDSKINSIRGHINSVSEHEYREILPKHTAV